MRKHAVFQQNDKNTHHVFRIEGRTKPAEPESCPSLELSLGTVNADTTVGMERIFVISVTADETAPRSDFTFLAQKRIPKSRKARKGGVESRADRVQNLLMSAGFGTAASSRGLDMPAPEAAAVEMQLFSWTTAEQVQRINYAARLAGLNMLLRCL
ncbi:hypothetical protein [Solemya elarraichensis gill symbiont]|uniref:Uncharacterized protein n=1 Tax=Solemya elarraichensis gill symbiont TaxID=1918949 RepID=A0A1T2KZH7_9GAMM|nr:hypothetical protein [Solemya elarraichensis gill symbiont]OOZ38242.1 hypothetical protein BOW52_08990 [Solemya elarraichensis gill symbiont]